jgi:hypothetical protein
VQLFEDNLGNLYLLHPFSGYNTEYMVLGRTPSSGLPTDGIYIKGSNMGISTNVPFWATYVKFYVNKLQTSEEPTGATLTEWQTYGPRVLIQEPKGGGDDMGHALFSTMSRGSCVAGMLMGSVTNPTAGKVYYNNADEKLYLYVRNYGNGNNGGINVDTNGAVTMTTNLVIKGLHTSTNGFTEVGTIWNSNNVISIWNGP